MKTELDILKISKKPEKYVSPKIQIQPLDLTDVIMSSWGDKWVNENLFDKENWNFWEM